MAAADKLRVTYITSGAAGMFCGSCLHDNTLVAALQKLGHDALLVPTYTPIRTDETDVSQRRVFMGGINVYLQQKLAIFRHTPWSFDRLLDANSLLRWASRFAVRTQAEELGDLTVSILQGEHGRQRKEVEKLARWLAREIRPQVVCVSNVLLSGILHELKQHLNVPVIFTLQGDDVFLDALPDNFRREALQLIRDHCREADGFIATCKYYADAMAEYFQIPRAKIDVVYPGLNLQGYGAAATERNRTTPTIGYFARICKEKGFHVLVDAFRRLRANPAAPKCRLRVSGWLGGSDRAYFDDLSRRIAGDGLQDSFEHVECPDHASKIAFYHSIDVLSVPTTYREPKGLYVLEALANGVPVVQPAHGSFPELIEATGGGLLFNPGDPQQLADGLLRLLTDASLRAELGRKGKAAVFERFHAQRMADETITVFRKYLN